jgi:hypothetical protein
MKYRPYLRIEPIVYPESRATPRTLSRPIHRDLQTLLALIEDQAEKDGIARNDWSHRHVAPHRYVRNERVPVLWEPEADDAPTVLDYRHPIHLNAGADEGATAAPLRERRRGQALLEFCVAFVLAALMVSALPAALWIAGVFEHKRANTRAAVPAKVAVALPSAAPIAPVAASAKIASVPSAQSSVPTAKAREAAAARPRATKARIADAAKKATSVPAEVGSASAPARADLDSTARTAAVPAALPRSDVARSL